LPLNENNRAIDNKVLNMRRRTRLHNAEHHLARRFSFPFSLSAISFHFSSRAVRSALVLGRLYIHHHALRWYRFGVLLLLSEREKELKRVLSSSWYSWVGKRLFKYK
jgi:hypothetical protein